MARIYLSSTYNDLIEHRATVYKSLRKMGHDVIAMEDYVACDDRPVDRCLEDVGRCDIYLGIFAWRYGFTPDGGQLSITEMEYRHASTHNIPCLIFLLHDNASWSPNLMDSHTGAGSAGESIRSLRNHLKNEKVVSFFTGQVDLAVEAAIAVYQHERGAIEKAKPSLWEYLLTIELLKSGIQNVDKKFSQLARGLIYRPNRTLHDFEILEWIRQKLDDLVALLALLKVSTTEELVHAWGKPGEAGDESQIREATTRILEGCNELLQWEIDLTFTRFPGKFENVKRLMQGWTHEYFGAIKHLNNQLETIVSDPDAEGVFKVSLVFEAPRNIDKIVPEVQKILNFGNPHSQK